MYRLSGLVHCFDIECLQQFFSKKRWIDKERRRRDTVSWRRDTVSWRNHIQMKNITGHVLLLEYLGVALNFSLIALSIYIYICYIGELNVVSRLHAIIGLYQWVPTFWSEGPLVRRPVSPKAR